MENQPLCSVLDVEMAGENTQATCLWHLNLVPIGGIVSTFGYKGTPKDQAHMVVKSEFNHTCFLKLVAQRKHRPMLLTSETVKFVCGTLSRGPRCGVFTTNNVKKEPLSAARLANSPCLLASSGFPYGKVAQHRSALIGQACAQWESGRRL